MKDYYKILGIEKNASKEEIRKAFHKLAHKYHPDKQGGDEAKFKEINEAYQILSDDSKRAQYDQFGSGAFSGAGAGPGAGGFNGFDFSNFDFSNMGGQSQGGFQFDLGDIFGEFFGGGTSTRTKRGRDISVDILISFKESIFGTERKLLINKTGSCDTCGGSGAAKGSSFKKCTTCNGKGKLSEARRSILGTFQTVKECSTCHGRGEIPEKKCPTCGGEGVVRKDEEVRVMIPAGISNGEMIRLTGRGEATSSGQAGDLYVKIHVERDSIWRREENNLTTDLKIKLSDAILGTEYKLKTLDGDLILKIPTGISYGEKLRIKGRGVPTGRTDRRGDILVRITFSTPSKLSKKAKKIIEDLKEEGL